MHAETHGFVELLKLEDVRLKTLILDLRSRAFTTWIVFCRKGLAIGIGMCRIAFAQEALGIRIGVRAWAEPRTLSSAVLCLGMAFYFKLNIFNLGVRKGSLP